MEGGNNDQWELLSKARIGLNDLTKSESKRDQVGTEGSQIMFHPTGAIILTEIVDISTSRNKL
jgi:hypothetical protein